MSSCGQPPNLTLQKGLAEREGFYKEGKGNWFQIHDAIHSFTYGLPYLSSVEGRGTLQTGDGIDDIGGERGEWTPILPLRGGGTAKRGKGWVDRINWDEQDN